MGHIVLDLTSLAHQPKSRERSARPTKHVTLCSHATLQELGDDEDDRPLVRSSHATVSDDKDEDDKPLMEPASKSETVKRKSASTRRVPTQ